LYNIAISIEAYFYLRQILIWIHLVQNISLARAIKKELSMKITLIQGVPFLEISDDCTISFQREWIAHLKALPYDQFGEYIKSAIYPALSDKERMIWNRSTISNLNLHQAIIDYTA